MKKYQAARACFQTQKVGWVKRSATQQSNLNVGWVTLREASYVPQTPLASPKGRRCANKLGNRKGAVAPQPTFKSNLRFENSP
ncbi:MAG: hypothetical protein V7K48_27870 [Nostoc sp.]|uniref:hypothetical protein n=1 Tax=Nostoc sp. TaxID=1180 RepID=UPI002FF5BC22